jgi:phosphate transport system substrate-binding protein
MKKIFLICLTALLAACGGSKDSVKVDGSSTVFPITEKVADAFREDSKGVRVTIGVSGTGAGFKKLIRNEVDIAEASRPVKKSEDKSLQEAGVEYIELPVAYDGLAVVVHPDNTWVDYLTVAELKKIWEPAAQGKITRWNQIRPEWPDQEIHLFGAGTQSGTFDYFTEAIMGEAKASRGDYTASEDDNVLVQGISTDPKALGFFGLDYYVANKDKLKLVPVDDENDSNGKGPVVPNAETVVNGTYQPLSRPLLIYVNMKSIEKEGVDKFVSYYINNASKLVPQSGYVALPNEVYDLVKKRYEKRVTGSVFLKLESTVGIKMEEILKMD